MKNYKNIYLLIKEKKFDLALNDLDKLPKNEIRNFEYYYLKGFSYLNLNKIDNAIKNFSLAIKSNEDNILSYFYRAIAYFKKNDFKNSKSDYEKAISLKPNMPELYNNLGSVNYKNGENEEAIKNFTHALRLNQNQKSSILGLLNVLTQTENVKDNSSNLIFVHNKLNEINFNYSENEVIEDKNIKKILSKINYLIDNKLNDPQLNIIQTYKENETKLNCNRHHKFFNKYDLIPEYCFGCFKIQIELDNVVELIKLHIVFDNFKFKKKNIRKCMIELRPNIPGKYKGLIYCQSLQEAEEVSRNLLFVTKNNFNKKISLNIKRGCSEFSVKFPKYNNLKKDVMNYDPNSKKYEDKFDKENIELDLKKKTRSTIKGITLYDALVIRNWLAYAKIIGDDTYKLISDKVFYSKTIEEKVKTKLLKESQLN